MMLKILWYFRRQRNDLTGKGVPAEDRELFERLSGGQSRNLADLITAKLVAHENRVQFKSQQTEPREPGIPPKVVEVYKKHGRSLKNRMLTVGWAYYCRDTSPGSFLRPSKSSRPLRIGKPFSCSHIPRIGLHMLPLKRQDCLFQILMQIGLNGSFTFNLVLISGSSISFFLTKSETTSQRIRN